MASFSSGQKPLPQRLGGEGRFQRGALPAKEVTKPEACRPAPPAEPSESHRRHESAETEARRAPEEGAAEAYFISYAEQRTDEAARRSERIGARSQLSRGTAII